MFCVWENFEFRCSENCKKKGIQTLFNKSKTYNDDKWKLLNKKNEICLHDRCYLDYSTGLYKLPESVDSPLSGRSSRAISTDSFDFKSLCLFCQKSYAKFSGEKHVIASESMKNKLLEIAEERNDDLAANVITVIGTVPSLVDVQARYHTNCFKKFVYIPRASSSSDIPDQRVNNAMQLIYNYIENHEECQFSMEEIQTVGKNELSDKTILKYLQIKYGDDITIITRPRKDTTICYSGTRSFPVDEFWYLVREEKKEDERIRIIKTAAELVRRQMKSVSYDNKSYPSSVNFLENVEEVIPNYLNIFLSELMLDKFSKKKNFDKDNSTNIESFVDEHPIPEGMSKF